jgi:hypothetical protein
MKITTTVLASVLFFACALTTDSQSFAQGACEGRPSSHKIMIHVSDNRPTRVTQNGQNADDVHVCIGDQIEWQLVGSAKQFYVDFISGTPFEGSGKKNSNSNGKISVVVGGSAQPGMAYKYDIGLVDGGVLDPRIIVGGEN